VNSLRRIKDAYHFYSPDSGVNENSYKDYLAQVRNIGKDEEMAKFLFHKVRIEPNWGLLSEQASGIFQQQLVEKLPQYADVPPRLLNSVYSRLLAFVQSRKNKPIIRLEIEDLLQSTIGERYCPSPKPIIVKTSLDHETELNTALYFDWSYFFGGRERNFPPTQDWNAKLLGELQETKEWIINHLRIRKIRLTGNRRLSASLAFGAVFSAVAGFTVEMEYRGDLWATDSHSTSSTPEFHWISNFEEGTGERLVVTIGIIRDIASEVKHYLKSEENLNLPLLNIKSDQPITSDEQANLAVRKLKELISQALLNGKFSKIELFFTGPSHLALFLGHRLNATAPIQCYEWVGSGKYVPTCLLKANCDVTSHH
jgi:hypothetical protein